MSAKLKQIQKIFDHRPYQEAAHKEAIDHLAKGERVVIVLPTGGGKTIVARSIIHDYLDMGERVLFLAHRRRLIQQAIEKIGTHPRFTAQTVQGFNSDIGRFGLIVTDEAHHVPAETYQAIYKANPDALLLGLTATPVRGDGSGLGNDFDYMVQTVSAKQLIDDGWLAGIKVFVPETAIDTSTLRSGKNGDFSLSGLGKVVKSEETARHAVGEYRKHADGLRGIVFCVDRAHTRMQNAAYIADGIRSVYMDGETAEIDERRIFKAWASREIDVICNCQLFTEGLDLPDVDFIQILRPTQSLPLYFQMIGRGMRPGDKPMRLLDHTLNWQLHGLPDEHGRVELPKRIVYSQADTPEMATQEECRVQLTLPFGTNLADVPTSGFKLVIGKEDGGPIVNNILRAEKRREESGEVVSTGRVIVRSAPLVEFTGKTWRSQAIKMFDETPSMTNAEISRLLGISASVVSRLRKSFDKQSPLSEKSTAEQRELAIQLFTNRPELTSTEIARIVGVHTSTICYWRKKLDFPVVKIEVDKTQVQQDLIIQKVVDTPGLTIKMAARLLRIPASRLKEISSGLNKAILDKKREKAKRLFDECPEMDDKSIANYIGVSVSAVYSWRKLK